MPLFPLVRFLPVQVFRKKIWITVLLWLLGIGLGLSYMALPPAAFFIILGCAALFFLSVSRLDLVFYLFIITFAVEYLNVFTDVNGSRMIFFPFHVFSFFIATGYVAARSIGKLGPRISTPVDGLLLFLLLYQFVSTIWAPDFMLSLYLGILLLFNYFIFYVSGAVVRDEKSLRTAINVIISTGVLVATGIIVSQWWQSYTTINITEDTGIYAGFTLAASRPAGVGYVDVVAGFVSMGIFLALGNIFHSKDFKYKAFLTIVVLYMLYAVILTTSRGAFISLVGGLIFFLKINPFTKGKIIKYTVLLGLVAIITILLAKPGFIDRILIGFGYTGDLYFSDLQFDPGSSKASGVSGMDQRTEWWSQALGEMRERPLTYLFGLGLGTFFHYTRNLEHSIPLSFFFEMGAIGVILFILLFTVIAVNLWKVFRKPVESYSQHALVAASTAALAIICINGLIYYDLVSRFFWFPIGFVMAIHGIIKSEIQQ